MQEPKINYDDPVILKRYHEFLKKYYDRYPKELQEKFPQQMGDDLKSGCIYDIMRQIYCAIGLIPNQLNAYRAYLELLVKYHVITRHLVEIGGGPYFLFAMYVDELQRKLGQGRMTVYDPRLVETKYGNINAIKDYFYEETDVSDIDLLVLIRTCGITKNGSSTLELALERSFEHKIDTFIALCSCYRIDENGFIIEKEEYHKMIIDMVSANTTSRDKVRILKLPDKHIHKDPIISITYDHQK